MTEKPKAKPDTKPEKPAFLHDTTLNIHQRLLLVMQEIDYVAKGEKQVNNQ